jgi:hypothetical protein
MRRGVCPRGIECGRHREGKAPAEPSYWREPRLGGSLALPFDRPEPAYVERVERFDPAGVKKSAYEANQYGVIYRETLYRPDGSVAATNGSSKLNQPL